MRNKNEIITRMLHTVSDLHVREVGEGEAPSRTITGYAILFNTPSAPLYSYDDEEAVEVISPVAITMEFLGQCDIKLTMFHDRQLILARSRNGKGTLSYDVDEKGVSFRLDAPNTADGDKALEMIRRGDISGCSFMFSTHYFDEAYVSRDIQRINGKTRITYTVKRITNIYDFTLAADPAYPDTSCETEARELVNELRCTGPLARRSRFEEQVREMRLAASRKLV